MAVIGQGLVLMVAGMGIVYLFLIVLIIVAKYASARFLVSGAVVELAW